MVMHVGQEMKQKLYRGTSLRVRTIEPKPQKLHQKLVIFHETARLQTDTRENVQNGKRGQRDMATATDRTEEVAFEQFGRWNRRGHVEQILQNDSASNMRCASIFLCQADSQISQSDLTV